MGNRRKARVLALQAMYQCDRSQGKADEVLPVFWSSQGRPEEETALFTEDLVRGVMREHLKIDAELERLSRHWSLDRMAVIDRNIIRLALYEIFFRDDIPPKVTINEYVSIAKKYSTEESGSFVNGILDRSLREREGTKETD
jgi:N utilization substance protein B